MKTIERHITHDLMINKDELFPRMKEHDMYKNLETTITEYKDKYHLRIENNGDLVLFVIADRYIDLTDYLFANGYNKSVDNNYTSNYKNRFN